MGFITAAVATAVVGSAVYSGVQSKPKTPKIEVPDPTDTGKIMEAEAAEVSRKRLYRLGLIGTSPTGLKGLGSGDEPLASARLR